MISQLLFISNTPPQDLRGLQDSCLEAGPDAANIGGCPLIGWRDSWTFLLY